MVQTTQHIGDPASPLCWRTIPREQQDAHHLVLVRLQAHSDLAVFLKWVKTKPPAFFEKSHKCHRLKKMDAQTMPRRNSPNTIRNLDDLSSLGEVVVDKRLGQRSSAKKNRRNRHYEKQFIRNALTQRVDQSVCQGDGEEHSA